MADCFTCKFRNKTEQEEPCVNCEKNANSISGAKDEFKPMTNADRIRNMTDEELAEHFSNFVKEAQSVVFCEDVSDWLKWLKLEVGE